MALPKRRHSHSRTRLRRSHDALAKPQLGACPECGEPIYKCDYPYIELGMICPVCEAMIEEE